MITYPDTGTHHWSLARVDVPFDWTRMPSGNDIAMHLLLVDPPHRTFAKVGAAVYHGGDDIIVAQTSRCARALPSVPVPTAALIPSLSGAAHRRTALQVPRVRSLSGSRLSLGLPKRFQSFLRLYAHPDPLLHPAPLRCAMDICSHIYPSLDPVLTPPLRVRPVSSCLHPHPDRHPRSSSSYGAPLLVPSPPQPPRRPAESAHPTPALRSRWSSSILSSLHSTHGRARAPKTFSFGRYLPRTRPTTKPKPKSSVTRPAPRPMGSVTVLPTTSPGESSRWQFCAGDMIDTGRHRAFHLTATDSIDRCRLR